ncbi:MAG: SdrD B-like domain-containing protein, partial [Methanothrix sp.]
MAAYFGNLGGRVQSAESREYWQYDLIRNKHKRGGSMRWLLLLALLAILLLASTQASLVKVGAYDTTGTAYGVALSGSYAYVADGSSGLRIIDISNPASPFLKGTYNTPGTAYGVALSGSYAYVADGSSGLQIIDISNPANPFLKGTYNTPGTARSVALSGSYAYVADGSSGLQTIDISNPANPFLKGTYDTTGYARSVALSGSYAYVADGDSGLQIIDISNPASPFLKGTDNTPGYAQYVALSGSYAYMAVGGSGLQIIDISDPANPFLKGTNDAPGYYAQGVALSGSYAYVADRDSGMRIIDISDPANPFLKGTYDTPGNANDVALSGGYAYVADGSSGLQILAEGATLGDYVWHDLNQNGVQDSGEQPIATVTVTLKNSTKTLTTTTNASGLYQFSNLVPGSYDNLTFTLPTGYSFTLQDRGGDNAKDSDVNPATGQTTSITLVSGQQDFTWDAGMYKPASISGTKFHDLDGDGTQDVGEGGLADWKIYNDSNNDGSFQEGEIWATTGWNGAYSLSGLAPGTYRVREVSQAGWARISPSTGYHEVVLTDANVTGQDFGNIPSLTVVKVTDPAGSADRFTFQNDIAPGNSFDLAGGEAKSLHADPGTYTINETGLAGWSLSDIHAAGTASVKYGKGTSFTHDDFIMGDTGVQVTLGASQYCRITFNNTRLATITGRVWDDQNYDGLQDADEPALAGIPVELVSESGDSLTPPQAASTDGSGNYGFLALPGRYKVMFTLPSAKAFSPKNQGADDNEDSDADPTSGKTDVITTAASQNYPHWDAGVYENEIIINEIYPNPEGNDNQDDVVSWERLELKNVGAADCSIGQWTIKDDDSPNLLCTIPAGTVLPAGEYLVVHIQGSSGGGISNSGDPVILCNFAGMEMNRIYCPSSSNKAGLSYSRLPDASENWGFWGEPTFGGDLSEMNLPGAANAAQDYGDAPDSAGTTRAHNGPRHFLLGPHLGSLIDYEPNGRPTVGANGDDTAGQDDEDGVTFFDLIAGQSATFNVTASAPGILQAWMDFNGDGAFDNSAERIATDQSLTAGEHSLSFTVPTGAASGYTYARLRFSSSSGLSPLGPAADGEVEDYRVEIKQQYFLGDRVWEDLNGDGLQSSGEPGVDGVTVNLNDAGNNIVASQTTASGGYYSFQNPLLGTYTMEFLLPQGYAFTGKDVEKDDEKDSDADPVTHLAGPVTVVLDQSNLTWDAGLYRSASISGLKFHDKNASGIKDPEEAGLKDWKIYLDLDDDAQWDNGSYPGTSAEPSAITDSAGSYAFSNLVPGSYRVREVLSEGWTQSCPAASVYVETLSSGQAAYGRDFGNHVVSGLSISGRKTNATGAAKSGWKITLTGTTLEGGAISQETTTASDGSYSFTGLLAGSYTVSEESRPDWVPVGPTTQSFDLVSSRSNVNFKNRLATSLSGLKFEDKDGDGLQDPGELGLKDWTITLRKPDGSEITTVTDTDGNYSFLDLAEGSYVLSEELQDGWLQTAPASESYTIDLLDAGVADLNFGNVPTASISGMKFEDLNGNGAKDTDESGLEGWTIKLKKYGTEIASTQTVAGGAYSFTGITPGSYTVEEVVKDGWTQSYPASPGTQTVTLVSGVAGPT